MILYFEPGAHLPRPVTAAAPSVPPLTSWCHLPPAALNLRPQQRLRAILVGTPPLPLSGWDAKTEADPAAAIGVAIATLAEGVVHPGRLDPALGTVLLCVALWDPACRDLLVHILNCRARRRADFDLLRLAHAWRDRSCRGLNLTLAPGR